MFTKFTIFVCIAIVQSISAQCIGTYDGAPWAPFSAPRPSLPAPYIAETFGYSPASLSASNGGSFAINSVSPISPTGIQVNSENAYEGAVNVAGKIPFLGTVGFDGEFPTVGAGRVSYVCGNAVAITSEGNPGYSEPNGFNGFGFNGCGRGI